MQKIIALIEEKQQIYSQSLLFEFLQDKTIHPAKRLSFAPCMIPFIMGFADLCKYVLRQEPTNDKIQAILNQHTYEDDFHWQWFLGDLEKLGFNSYLQLNDSLVFLWSEETKASRFLMHELYKYIVQAEAIEKFVILEAMEACADVFLSFTKQITDELQILTHQEYKYFGNLHCNAEQSHNDRGNEVRKQIENIYIPEQNRQRSIDLIDQVFALFTQWNHSLLTYAQGCQEIQPLNQQIDRENILEAA